MRIVGREDCVVEEESEREIEDMCRSSDEMVEI
jgi:hypothetical protein